MKYIEAIGVGFPGVECHSMGDGSVYEDIVWDGGVDLPSKETLDAWIAANNTTIATAYITAYAFRQRFTTAEKIAIEFATLDNPKQQQSSACRLLCYVYRWMTSTWLAI